MSTLFKQDIKNDTEAVQLVRQWIRALRGGVYHQGHGRLRIDSATTPKFCCLGVLCDLINPRGWAGSEWRDKEGHTSVSTLTQLVKKSIHIDNMLMVDDIDSLISLNDDEGHNFWKIADVIERQLDEALTAA